MRPRAGLSPVHVAGFFGALALAAIATIAALAAGRADGPTQGAADAADAPPPGPVGYVRIEGAIDRLQARYLTRALADARAGGLRTIIVHLDTDGRAGALRAGDVQSGAAPREGAGGRRARSDVIGRRRIGWTERRARGPGTPPA